MNYKALTLGALIGFVVSMSPSCGPPAEEGCGPTTCATGCCDGAGACIVVGTNNACGTGGLACTPCAGNSQCVNNVCTGGNTDAGTDAGTHKGCYAGTSKIAVPGTSPTNCGHDGQTCVSCPAGQYCADFDNNPATTQGGECRIVPVPDAGADYDFGIPCTTNADCSSIGGNAVCKLTTSSGNASYAGGYCTRPCDPAVTNDCGVDGYCANFTRYGEDGALCYDRCGGARGNCRTPGYTCYTITGTQDQLCWISPLPQPDAGPPPPDNLIGSSCATDVDCQATGAFPAGTCIPEATDAGATGFTTGYCTADCSNSGAICGNTGICIGFSQTSAFCMDRCTAGGAGQSNCNSANYVCESYLQGDGGVSTDGFCWPHCNNPGGGCPSGQTCNTTTGYCQ